MERPWLTCRKPPTGRATRYLEETATTSIYTCNSHGTRYRAVSMARYDDFSDDLATDDSVFTDKSALDPLAEANEIGSWTD